MLARIFIVTIMIMVCCNAGSPVKASEEDILQPYEVAVIADAGKSFGEVAVEIKTNKDPEKLKIASIRLKINGEWKSVPEKAFADLEKPDLNSLQIRTEAGYDENPWLYVYFELFYRDESGRYAPNKRVHISYHKDRFESRTIDVPMSDGSRKWDKMEL